MKKFFQSKGFIVTSLAVLCVTILDVCWFASRDHTEDFKLEESPPSSTTNDWLGGNTQTDGESDARAHALGQSFSPEGEYSKVTSEVEDEVVIDFTDTEESEITPPPAPGGRTEREDSGEDHLVNPNPGVPKVTIPLMEKKPVNNEPAPGASNGSGTVYDPVFGWIVPGNGQETIGGSDGDINEQVGSMGRPIYN